MQIDRRIIRTSVIFDIFVSAISFKWIIAGIVRANGEQSKAPTSPKNFSSLAMSSTERYAPVKTIMNRLRFFSQ